MEDQEYATTPPEQAISEWTPMPEDIDMDYATPEGIALSLPAQEGQLAFKHIQAVPIHSVIRSASGAPQASPKLSSVQKKGNAEVLPVPVRSVGPGAQQHRTWGSASSSSAASAAKPQRRGLRGLPRIALQCGICVALLLSVLLLKALPWTWAQEAVDGVRQAVMMDVDLEKGIGQLKFVQAIFDEQTAAAFATDPKAAAAKLPADFKIQPPMEGTVVGRFDPPEREGLDIQGAEGATIYACLDGTVTTIVPLDNSTQMTIDHGGGLYSVYIGLDQSTVKQGDAVRALTPIGMLSGQEGMGVLRFELRLEQTAIDPLYLIAGVEQAAAAQ